MAVKKIITAMAAVLVLSVPLAANATVYYCGAGEYVQVRGIDGNVYSISTGPDYAAQQTQAMWTAGAGLLGSLKNSITASQTASTKNQPAAIIQGKARPDAQAKPFTFVNPEDYLKYKNGARAYAEDELRLFKKAAKTKGTEAFFSFLKKYCDERNIKYSTVVSMGILRSTMNLKNDSENPFTADSSVTYEIDMPKNLASVTVNIPRLSLGETASDSYTEAIPQSLKAFGMAVTCEPYLYAGYEGFIVKEIRPFSKAEAFGFKLYDQIIKIDNYTIQKTDTVDGLLKMVNKQLYRNKYPVTIFFQRNGNLQSTVLKPM